MWRILEKSDFRPTDDNTKKFRAEKFKQRWFAYYVIQDMPSLVTNCQTLITRSSALTKMKSVSPNKKQVSPAPDHDAQKEKAAHAIKSTASVDSTKTTPVTPVKTKSFVKVAPAPDNGHQVVDSDQMRVCSLSATGSANESTTD